MLIFDGRPIWFHSVNSESLILAIFDYIDAMLEADRYLPPTPILADHVFNGFAWDGTEGQPEISPTVTLPEPIIETEILDHLLEAEILLLTHADTDLLSLERATQDLPENFPKVRGINLKTLPTQSHVTEFIRTELKRTQVIVLRSWGGKQGFEHGFDQLVQFVTQTQKDLICIPGTEALDPELTAHSTVSVPVLHDTYQYLHFGGVENTRQLLYFLADNLLLGGFGYQQPLEQPRHGLYRRSKQIDGPTIGILFYRSHYLSGNVDFIDALVDEIEAQGASVVPVYTTSLKEQHQDKDQGQFPSAFHYFYDEDDVCQIDSLICTISFAMGGINVDGPTQASWNVTALQTLGVPIIQAITSGMSEESWQLSQRGLRPLDVAMNVALPEFDGRIISVPLSFKGNLTNGHHENGLDAERYIPIKDRVSAVARQALKLANLRHKPNQEKRVAFILTNSPGKADRIGNAVGLDAPASLMTLFAAMQTQGYQINDLPEDSDTLLHTLIERCSYDELRLTETQLAQASGRVSVPVYEDWFEALPVSQQTQIQDRWGNPPGEAYVHQDYKGQPEHLALAGLELGNVFIALQPPRGYGMDPDAIYHTPDLPPTHNYYALYRWLSTPASDGGWGADALVHVGKHGTLEWLPGKGIGLSQDCFPDTFLADMPLIYPFIINNPGEGAQAKRRAHAVIIDHMIPPMTSADVYGELAQLTQLVDEYYQVEQMDPAKLPLVQQQIWQLMQQTNLDQDIATMLRSIDHGDHTHEWDGSYTDDGTPLTLAEMNATDFSHLLEDIDGYLCELGSLQIRDGLHTLGHIPEGDQLCALIRALTRIPNGDIPSLRAEIATAIGFDLDELLSDRGKKFTKPLPNHPSIITHADAIELIDTLSLDLIKDLEKSNFNLDEIPNSFTIHHSPFAIRHSLHLALAFICTTLVPLIRQNDDEITHTLNALNGQYVPAGPAGAPTRGMAQILPTGRNFYAVDPRAIPSQAAWRIGQELANELIAQYLSEENEYPERVGLSIWGTSAMRTHGDDIAQCFALLGVRPVWQAESRRVTEIEVIPLAELGRPRIDVVMRISGFFRDAFPHLIDLMDEAAHLVAQLDEPPEQNFLRKAYLKDVAQQIAAGQTDEIADRRASYRVFGSKPGAYGAGILPLINNQNWQDETDFAEAYVNWGGYAYGQNTYGDDARNEFKTALGGVQVAVKNQDNREHDIFDSDDYLQYHGGMIATIRSLNGRNPKSYFGDNSDPSRAEVRTLQQESYRVFRSRVVNPKWIEGIQRHGYKGALELAATVDYLFGYDATAKVVDDWMYEQTAQTYALDPQLQAFFQKSNPWALQSITERLLEAAQRGMWAEPDNDTLDQLRNVYLRVDADLEG
ncbi:MAG: cobaltochelatase subunit CobN [Chloroflexota bacterium]